MTDSFRPTSFRHKAWEALRGKWGMSAVSFLIYLVIACTASGIASLIPFIGTVAVTILFVSIIGMGIMFLFLDVSNGDEVKIDTTFEAFKDYVRYLGGSALTFLYTFLWMLLFIIPGIIKSYSYSMTFYIMRENPEMEAENAIQRSMAMMKGHKWQLFLLQLSFIGWGLLSILTLGIGLLWLYPYIATATAEFYKELKKEYEVREGLSA